LLIFNVIGIAHWLWVTTLKNTVLTMLQFSLNQQPNYNQLMRRETPRQQFKKAHGVCFQRAHSFPCSTLAIPRYHLPGDFFPA